MNQQAAPPLIPSPIDLGHDGKVYMLTLLHFRILCGEPVDTDYWRDAYGQAADYQTVVACRRELAAVTR